MSRRNEVTVLINFAGIRIVITIGLTNLTTAVQGNSGPYRGRNIALRPVCFTDSSLFAVLDAIVTDGVDTRHSTLSRWRWR